MPRNRGQWQGAGGSAHGDLSIDGRCPHGSGCRQKWTRVNHFSDLFFLVLLIEACQLVELAPTKTVRDNSRACRQGGKYRWCCSWRVQQQCTRQPMVVSSRQWMPAEMDTCEPLFRSVLSCVAGMVVVGWLGRGTTTLHCTHYALTHRLKVLSLFLFVFSFPRTQSASL